MSDPTFPPGGRGAVAPRIEDPATGGGLVELTTPEAVALLSEARYGRLVFTYRAMPEIIPVNFRVVDDAVVVRVSGTSRAVEGAVDTVVAFQVDDIDSGTRTGWSVTVLGPSHEILDPAQRQRILELPLESWAGGGRDRLIRVPMQRITGRRLLPPAVAPAL